MRQRCANPRNKGYRHYGGRGIRVCERWRFTVRVGTPPQAADGLLCAIVTPL